AGAGNDAMLFAGIWRREAPGEVRGRKGLVVGRPAPRDAAELRRVYPSAAVKGRASPDLPFENALGVSDRCALRVLTWSLRSMKPTRATLLRSQRILGLIRWNFVPLVSEFQPVASPST